jgi:hypothetical protein
MLSVTARKSPPQTHTPVMAPAILHRFNPTAINIDMPSFVSSHEDCPTLALEQQKKGSLLEVATTTIALTWHTQKNVLY